MGVCPGCTSSEKMVRSWEEIADKQADALKKRAYESAGMAEGEAE